MKREKVDVLVIGAGPSGTVAASIINKSGLKVKVVEKQKFPRFVIGESLLPRCMEHLEAAGFLEAIKKKGFQEKFGAKFVKGDRVSDFNFSDQFSNGWTWTWQVPRAEFDKILSDEIQRMGVEVSFETGVTDIKFQGTDSVTTVEDIHGNKSEIEARFIIDASGYGRVIPKLFNLDKPSVLPPRKALFVHSQDKKRPAGTDGNRITVIVHKTDVWIWVIPFSNGNTSIGFVGSPEFFESVKGNKEERLRQLMNSEPHLKDRFEGAEFIWEEPKVLEGWSISTKKFYGDGFVLTGNSTEFLDPIFSSGVTLATESGHKAADLAVKQLKGGQVDWEKEFVEHTMQGVSVFRTYVMSWYDGSLQDIFFAKNQNEKIKQQICSVLAGYVWDLENPFVRKHQKNVATLAEVIRLDEAKENVS
jgi:flavin-dependent dehydrogenase